MWKLPVVFSCTERSQSSHGREAIWARGLRATNHLKEPDIGALVVNSSGCGDFCPRGSCPVATLGLKGSPTVRPPRRPRGRGAKVRRGQSASGSWNSSASSPDTARSRVYSGTARAPGRVLHCGTVLASSKVCQLFASPLRLTEQPPEAHSPERGRRTVGTGPFTTGVLCAPPLSTFHTAAGHTGSWRVSRGWAVSSKDCAWSCV